MNLLIKMIYLFTVLMAGKIYIPIKVEGVMNQNLAMIALLYVSNVVYRIIVNRIFKKKFNIKNTAKEALNRTILIIVGIVAVNYLISNPEILGTYGIQIPYTDMKTSTALSLAPILLSNALLAHDI